MIHLEARANGEDSQKAISQMRKSYLAQAVEPGKTFYKGESQCRETTIPTCRSRTCAHRELVVVMVRGESTRDRLCSLSLVSKDLVSVYTVGADNGSGN